MRTKKATYKGLIVEPAVRDYFINKIQLQKSGCQNAKTKKEISASIKKEHARKTCII